MTTQPSMLRFRRRAGREVADIEHRPQQRGLTARFLATTNRNFGSDAGACRYLMAVQTVDNVAFNCVPILSTAVRIGGPRIYLRPVHRVGPIIHPNIGDKAMAMDERRSRVGRRSGKDRRTGTDTRTEEKKNESGRGGQRSTVDRA
jgi:hypothetical protein